MIPKKNLDLDLLRQLWLARPKIRVADIAKQLGCSKSLASAEALKLGLPRRTTSSIDLPQKAMVAAILDHGMSVAELRAELQKQFPTISESAIRIILERQGVPMQALLEEKHREITRRCVNMRRSNMSLRRIERITGLSRDIVARRCRSVLGKDFQQNHTLEVFRKQFLKLFREKKNVMAVAKEMGMYTATIYHRLKRLGISIKDLRNDTSVQVVDARA